MKKLSLILLLFVSTAFSQLRVGMDVYVVQKTKRELGTVTKINIKKAIVQIGSRSYRVPLSMLEVA